MPARCRCVGVASSIQNSRRSQDQIGMQFMSSLLDRDLDSDQRSLYAPKWVREAAPAERRGLAPKFPDGIGAGDTQQPTATPAPSDGHLAIDGTCLPRSLEPTL